MLDQRGVKNCVVEFCGKAVGVGYRRSLMNCCARSRAELFGALAPAVHEAVEVDRHACHPDQIAKVEWLHICGHWGELLAGSFPASSESPKLASELVYDKVQMRADV